MVSEKESGARTLVRSLLGLPERGFARMDHQRGVPPADFHYLAGDGAGGNVFPPPSTVPQPSFPLTRTGIESAAGSNGEDASPPAGRPAGSPPARGVAEVVDPGTAPNAPEFPGGGQSSSHGVKHSGRPPALRRNGQDDFPAREVGRGKEGGSDEDANLPSGSSSLEVGSREAAEVPFPAGTAQAGPGGKPVGSAPLPAATIHDAKTVITSSGRGDGPDGEVSAAAAATYGSPVAGTLRVPGRTAGKRIFRAMEDNAPLARPVSPGPARPPVSGEAARDHDDAGITGGHGQQAGTSGEAGEPGSRFEASRGKTPRNETAGGMKEVALPGSRRDEPEARSPAPEEGRVQLAVPGEPVPEAREVEPSRGLAQVTEAELDRGRYHPAFAALLEQGESGGKQVDRLRHSFHELLARQKAAGRGEKEEKRLSGQERQDDRPGPPPLQQIVIVKRQAGPQAERRPAAFWERNGMGHFNLKAGR